MDVGRETILRAAAAERAREYRAQAAACRRLGMLEPLPHKRRLLALSAARYDQVAQVEERIAFGGRGRQRLAADPEDVAGAACHTPGPVELPPQQSPS